MRLSNIERKGIQLNKAMDSQGVGLRAGMNGCAACGVPVHRMKRTAFLSGHPESAPCVGESAPQS